MADTVPVLVYYPKKVVSQIDNLVKSSLYSSRSDALRDAARTLIRQERGILVGKESKDSLGLQREVRESIWNEALAKAGGNEKKAIDSILKELKKVKM